MSSVAENHAAEVRQGVRFEFGKNWQRFLNALTEQRIAIAQQSLVDYLELPRLDGLRFLDIGSGSGLLSLVARRLGASVTSFDYDPHSVACTAELRRRYFPDDPQWRVLQGSVLDRAFLATLGAADIVYSWGVLHHTGAMMQAFANIEPLVPVGGRLFIAIYNDLGPVTDRWWRVKRRYNALPATLRRPYALGIIGAAELRGLLGHIRAGDLRAYLRVWTDYQHTSVRGMSRWHDWIDWIGGFPYERATTEAIVDTFAADGFRLTKLVDRSTGYGCNEFVFRREAPAGSWVEQPVPGSRLLSRRFGTTLSGMRRDPDGGLVAALGAASPTDGQWLAMQRHRLLGEGVATGNALRFAPEIAAAADPDNGPIRLVLGVVEMLRGPFTRIRGKMWQTPVPHLASLADDAGARVAEQHSPVFVFEGDRQLALPHSMHDEIARRGGGRFSHWGGAVYFSTTDGSDPNTNTRAYRLVYPACAAPAARLGEALNG
jgi:2-polyprenyl-6-hydroxyphenyl methylase/3-demethylubiquinone-9 3-methyltransferase